MRWIGTFTKIWAYAGISAVCAAVLFLFGYVFFQGAGIISVEFLTEAPKGLVLGEEGGIWPAITGSLCFTGTAMVLASVPAAASALYLVFYCRSQRLYQAIRLVIQCISGIPSIVLGLFAYSFLVRDLNLGRCIFSAGVALAVMILPFIEVRAEKAFRRSWSGPHTAWAARSSIRSRGSCCRRAGGNWYPGSSWAAAMPWEPRRP